MIIKGLKVHENLNEIECMLKYLEKLQLIWKYNEETYKCFLGVSKIKIKKSVFNLIRLLIQHSVIFVMMMKQT